MQQPDQRAAELDPTTEGVLLLAHEAQHPALLRPKVLFIQPKLSSSLWGLEYSAYYAGWRYPNPPLGIMTLAGAISPDWEVEIRDENVGPVEYATEADIVGMSATHLDHYHVNRVKELADYFRKQGKVVCIGGPVANLAPDAVRAHCDVLFEGEGELTWPQFLKDYEAGTYKDRYEQLEKIDMSLAPTPRIDLVNAPDYGAGQIQTTRGCPFTCEFCDIIVVFGRKVRTKPIEKIINEVKLWADAGLQCIFFSDDNFVGNRVHAKSLLRELIKFNARRRYPVSFYTQASIDTARDPELMELMRDANFFALFIGIESPRKSSLSETLKVQNVHTGDLAEAIHTIQSYGLWVAGGMIVGFDHDDVDIFEEQYEFVQRAGVVCAQVTLLEAVPKTPLYERMKESRRLIEYRQNLPTNIIPVGMSSQELVTGYRNLVNRLYTFDAFVERFLNSLSYMKKNKLSGERIPLKATQFVSLLRTLSYYCLTPDSRRRKFFFEMMAGTFRIHPGAWKWTIRYLLSFIHFHKFANQDVMVVSAPLTHDENETVNVRRAIAG